jgi:hypothetical protein
MMITTREQSLPSWGTQGCRMEPVVAQTTSGQPICHRSVDRAAESTRRTKPNIVQKNHENVRSTFRRKNLSDRRIRRIGILCVVCCQTDVFLLRNRQG